MTPPVGRTGKRAADDGKGALTLTMHPYASEGAALLQRGGALM